MTPHVNYREMALQVTDLLDAVRHPHAHICTVCLGKALEEIVQPMLEVAVSQGRAEQREQTVKDLMPNCGGQAE